MISGSSYWLVLSSIPARSSNCAGKYKYGTILLHFYVIACRSLILAKLELAGLSSSVLNFILLVITALWYVMTGVFNLGSMNPEGSHEDAAWST